MLLLGKFILVLPYVTIPEFASLNEANIYCKIKELERNNLIDELFFSSLPENSSAVTKAEIERLMLFANTNDRYEPSLRLVLSILFRPVMPRQGRYLFDKDTFEKDHFELTMLYFQKLLANEFLSDNLLINIPKVMSDSPLVYETGGTITTYSANTGMWYRTSIVEAYFDG